MKTKLMLCLFTLSLAAANAASSYNLTLTSPVSVGGTELKPGEYKVAMSGDKAVFKLGKTTVEVPATLSAGDHKYSSTSLLSKENKVEEIDLGGTSSKIVFTAAASANGTK